MNVLIALEGLIAGVWLGAYLFTTLVVSPALRQLPLSDAERVRTRSAIGRRYGKLATPLLVMWLLALLMQGVSAQTALRLGLLLALTALVGLHAYWLGVRMERVAAEEMATGMARAGIVPKHGSWLTYVGLGVSLALALLTLSQGL